MTMQGLTRGRWRWACGGLVGLLAGLFCGPLQAARLWQIGPGELGTTLQAAGDGDTIELRAGLYLGEGGVIRQRDLTLRGAGAVLQAGHTLTEDKAILVLKGGHVRLEGLVFRGGRVPDQNGAAIRLERGRLSLVRCQLSGQEMGLLTSNQPDVELTIEDSEFGPAAERAGAGLHHLLYVGRIARLEVLRSHFHGGRDGHLIKSRARQSWLAHNRIEDDPEGRASYELDFPNGGEVTLLDNRIAQSGQTRNLTLIAYGAEGQAWPGGRLTLQGNVLVNGAAPWAPLVRLWSSRLPGGVEARGLDNQVEGGGWLDGAVHWQRTRYRLTRNRPAALGGRAGHGPDRGAFTSP
ncbi:hypothetical protein HNQ51_003125 [Inhella inkyongensis]|uniref:Right handed beta helix domain-containing protein n=1 Tax=Inhella inkyongensis TaxID=392593 RepID=A0A840S8G5_9BURK|nr:hypothetical protein [Inhella inkyongensis]MBB5205798.1 hypothetical protein [Inhella inkyongensis]